MIKGILKYMYSKRILLYFGFRGTKIKKRSIIFKHKFRVICTMYSTGSAHVHIYFLFIIILFIFIFIITNKTKEKKIWIGSACSAFQFIYLSLNKSAG
jgi:hypothetical protein